MERKFNTLAEMYRRSISEYPDREFIAVKKNGQYQWTTYKAFGELVENVRGGFADLGVAKGDRVAVISDNRPQWAASALATFGLGAVYVPMYEAQMPDEWAFIVSDCEAKFVLAGDKAVAEKVLSVKDNMKSVATIIVLDTSKGVPEGTVGWEDVIAKGKEKPAPMVDVTREDLADIIYTSGTTGKPKGVMLNHGNLADNINACIAAFPFDPNGETSLAFLPWAHAFGQVAELLALFSMGGRMALAESPTTLIANLGEIKPTILFSVPRVWNKVYGNLHKRMADEGGLKEKLFNRALALATKREEGKLGPLGEVEFKLLDKVVFSKVRAVLGGNLKFAISGAAALSPEVARFVSHIGITVCEGWGLTETSPAATFNRPGDVRIGTVGVPIPGVEVYTVPVENAPEGQGELVVKGHNIMQGYYNRPEETAKVMLPDGGFKTGDLGFVDADKFVHITGRVKEQFKLENGKYVAPAPLEEAIKLSPNIGQAFIHGANKPYNVALIVLDPENMPGWAEANGLGGKSLDELAKNPAVHKMIQEELRKYSTEFKGFEKIQNFAVLSEEFTTENGMLTPTMKVKRQQVMNQYGDLIESLYKKNVTV